MVRFHNLLLLLNHLRFHIYFSWKAATSVWFVQFCGVFLDRAVCSRSIPVRSVSVRSLYGDIGSGTYKAAEVGVFGWRLPSGVRYTYWCKAIHFGIRPHVSEGYLRDKVEGLGDQDRPNHEAAPLFASNLLFHLRLDIIEHSGIVRDQEIPDLYDEV